MSRKSLEQLQTELSRLNLEGRDSFHTHLIQQEIPFWLGAIYDGGAVEAAEVRSIANRRGFDSKERRRFFALARWLNEHAAELRACRPAESKHRSYMQGWEDGARGLPAERKNSLYASGHAAGKASRSSAARKFARQIGYALPRQRRISPEALEKAAATCRKAAASP